jgi:hypothetical protein
MMPPICSICNARFDPLIGGLIYFEEDEEDKICNERLRQPGFCGHPSNAYWFCEFHINEAKKYQKLTKKKAMKIIRDFFNK